MNFNLMDIVAEMNIFALIVVGVLGVMALATITIFVERWWTYARSSRRARRFGPTAARLLKSGDYGKLRKAAEDAPKSYLPSMLNAGVVAYDDALENPESDVAAAELVRRELSRKGDAQSAELKRGLNVLASVGSTAPFVGLLGTVIGIISAFQGIAAEGSGGLGAVSAGISEALVVTALGLMVAIPAVLIFNFLTARADRVMLSLDQARGQFIDHIEAHHSAHTAREPSNISPANEERSARAA